jgi:excinuclease ABC subunit A
LQRKFIEIRGASANNLANIDVSIPRGEFVVVTGLSGSGKSSLAFDTIYAEGQRRYIETFSAYARNFLGNLSRPDVDKITGLSPVIFIEQKTTNKNPRSTVGTTTEIYDYLRLLFARAGEAYSYLSGEKMVKYTEEQILDLILKDYHGKRIYILAPLVKSRKGHYRELFETIRRKGFINVRVDGDIKETVPGMKVDRYKNHDIEVVIDKLRVTDKDDVRLKNSVNNAIQQGNGLMLILDDEAKTVKHYSKLLMDPVTGLSYPEPAPHSFSFNSPQGACPKCKGLGIVSQIDIDKVIPDRSISVRDGGIIPLGKFKNSMVFWQVEAVLEKYEASLDTPISELSDEAIDEIIYGTSERIKIKSSLIGTSSDYFMNFEGVVKYITMLQENDASATEQKWAEKFAKTTVCPECGGAKLNKIALSYRIHDKNIYELSCMDINELYDWMQQVNPFLSHKQGIIAAEILKEIRTRLKFLLDIGLEYLSLDRSSASLSGGESQRIRLATQIGSQLVNVLYILDEPSIGLHQRDNQRLIKSLKDLRDLGNTVIVVEHDKDMMLAVDYVVDLGPKAGRLGGKVVFQGTPQEMMKTHTLTSQYLNGEKRIEIPLLRRPGNGKKLIIRGASGNNLKHIDVEFPLGKLICVTGVSGSGKSTLINETLHPILSQKFYRSLQDPLPYLSIEGIENIDKVVDVDQSPIGRTPRSNPATYTNVFTDIRNLFVDLPEAKVRGYKSGRFSFNAKGGG